LRLARFASVSWSFFFGGIWLDLGSVNTHVRDFVNDSTTSSHMSFSVVLSLLFLSCCFGKSINLKPGKSMNSGSVETVSSLLDLCHLRKILADLFRMELCAILRPLLKEVSGPCTHPSFSLTEQERMRIGSCRWKKALAVCTPAR
jgi:hypothetical protein